MIKPNFVPAGAHLAAPIWDLFRLLDHPLPAIVLLQYVSIFIDGT